ncbi:N-acetylmannosamine-6-phosphate 2-epimerase [Mycoplasma iguanae]|uniref:Putative N-acetylmannosamine-6-phosphate 2-epimerase n=1 Tax=Mycoplasma iguanae TaxID=292461 RepID=A0ABY5R9L8_9MOLU|nr:N-acetylmannosamine-6-phosphate 2-epimerase [Mycoplasma iguanae]UVD81872.1 N-acetylmannosamine-6-phosphate 2-epimerase [Mycoplasma iguanae]
MLKENTFIVSCQALENEPMFGPGIVLKMAQAVIQGGAEGLRTSQLDNVKDIMSANFNVPVISLIKKKYENSGVFITPTLDEVKQLMAAGATIIATDATLRQRPKESLEEIVTWFKKHRNEKQFLMADCSNEEDVLNAIKLDFDYIGTTLRGYTQETKSLSNIDDDMKFLKWAKKQTTKSNKLLIAEGGFDTPQLAKKALKIADVVVVGSAITRPQFITKLFVDEIKK